MIIITITRITRKYTSPIPTYSIEIEFNSMSHIFILCLTYESVKFFLFKSKYVFIIVTNEIYCWNILYLYLTRKYPNPLYSVYTHKTHNTQYSEFIHLFTYLYALDCVKTFSWNRKFDFVNCPSQKIW